MIEHNVFVAVIDGQRALVYRNVGKAQTPHLELVSGFEHKHPPSRALGTDKAPTGFSGASGIRSASSERDFHTEEEFKFAKDVLRELDALKQAGKIEKLVLVAPAKMLAVLRHHMSSSLKAIIVSEVSKDLTKHKPDEIIKILAA
jgi:protein required for attachment to host cells